ncbi:MAG: ornithine--acyl-ACP N-acyltransferase OlsB [Hyphomicrobiales bacterium]|nr:MAG: ornithine--acyl-ACP N-acyltransferase OlsB [Hyphomicrobiales bacterium]
MVERMNPGKPDRQEAADRFSLSRSCGVLARRGALEMRLAVNEDEIRQCQELRYQVFYREMAATPSDEARRLERDEDRFDDICDHLLVIDNDAAEENGRGRIVGTYRLLQQEIAEQNGGFYSADEYEIGPLIARHPDLRFLELGRSCVLKPYRTRPTVELLWQGIWNYVRKNRFDVMIGCASLSGTDPDALSLPLTFLHHHAAPPPQWHARAVAARYVAMDRLAAGDLDEKAALRSLPPLIRGYLRLGAYIGEGAVVDSQFGTTDVLIILPVEKINPRYLSHFDEPGERLTPGPGPA